LGVPSFSLTSAKQMTPAGATGERSEKDLPKIRFQRV
jgi:hypothetical protein